MTREEFDSLVRKLEGASKKHPRLYLARVIGLVALAYTYLLLVLAGSLLLAVAMIVMVVHVPATAKLGLLGLIAFGGIFWAVLRGMWVKLQPPSGPEITRAQAPRLFALLDELRAALQCRPFHKVILIGEMNAAVVQIPRLGIFGWHTNYLLLGLPLLQSLAPDEFKAVLAHEFAHASGGHGSFGNWLYRVRRTWQQIFEQMARQRTRFGAVLYKFVNWFWPLFNGHAFVLARANEYEADACAVRLAGPDAAASALMRLPVTNTLLSDKFWPQIFSLATQEKEPPGNVMLAMQQSLRTGLAPAEAQKSLRQGFLLETSNADTHPCLKDRLRAMGRLPAQAGNPEFTVEPPPPPHQSAAEVFLADQSGAVAQLLSDQWRQAVAQQWAARHEHAQKLAGDLAALETPADAPPTAAQLWEKAHKLIQLHSDQEALPVIEQLLALEPAHPAGNFILGRHRLKNDDPGGVALIEGAMDADPELTKEGCNLLYAYYRRTGQPGKIKPLEARMDKFQAITALASQERQQINAANTFIPAMLTPQQLESLLKIFAAEPEIAAAGIARKQVEHFQQSPCYVIGLEIKVPFWKLRRSSANAALVNRVLKQVRLPGCFLVFVNGKNLKALWTKVSAVPGAVIYRRTEG